MQPPDKIPVGLESDFTMQGLVGLRHLYIDGTNGKAPHYDKGVIESNIKLVLGGKKGYYEETDTSLYKALEKYPIKDMNVAVFGSAAPWYEGVALAHGAKKCYVYDYNVITTNHPQIIPKQVNELDINAEVGFSISSFEHDGLGRYGDAINPNADLQAMDFAKKIISKGGLLYLAVPIGVDKVVFNAHRIYGKHRLPRMLCGWELVDSFGYSEEFRDTDTGAEALYQPVFVLRNVQ